MLGKCRWRFGINTWHIRNFIGVLMAKYGFIGAGKAPSQSETANSGVFTIEEIADLAQNNDATFTRGGTNVEYLVIGGGGAGQSGGGSGGGIRSGTFSANNGITYTVTVGGGGGTSSIVGDDGRTVVQCIKGGDGGGDGFNGGGGNANGNNRGYPRLALEPDGKNGAMGSGLCGSGGSSVALQAGNGNVRIASSGAAGTNLYSQWATDTSSGHSGYYGGGGGGNSNNYEQQHFASGGTGGGGRGGQNGLNNNAGQAGTANTGGGGGGGSSSGAGGSGLVIIRVPDSLAALTTTGSPSTYTANGYDYYKFTASGSFTV